MVVRRIEFFFDYISPYAFLAWTQIHALSARHGRSVVPEPVSGAMLLGLAAPCLFARRRKLS